jgi:basic membrane protein A
MDTPKNVDGQRSTSGYFIYVLITALFFLVFFFTQMVAHTKTLKVIVLTDAAGLGDKGFNDVCWKGVERAKKDFGLKTQFLQSREQADYVSNLTLAARHADVVITLGYLFVDAVKQVVPHFPTTRFIHIEGDISGDNVASFDFKSEEGGFLAGLVAGLFTKSKKVGMICGMDIPPVEAYAAGFKAGVQTAEKHRKESLETIITYVGSFNDPVKGKSLAQALMNKSADVIFRAAGNSGVGVLEAVKDSKGIYLIAEDLDQDAELPGRILTSTLKRMDVAVYEALQDIVQRNFQSGHYWLGSAEGGVDITEMKYSGQLFNAKDLKTIQKARALLKDRKLTIPARYSQIENFQPPDL